MRWWVWLIAVVVVIGAGAGIYLLKPINGPARDLTLAGDLTRGNYLVRLGGCVACHTDIKNGGAFLAGGVPLGTAFGSFVPPNITPDPDAGIGNWTLAEFSDAMSNGTGPGGKHFYPAFPYESYTLMSDQEIADLWVALQAVEPVATKAAESQIPFPFNIRLGMAAWQNLFFKPARFAPTEGKSEAWNRGKYLVNGPAHCVACHTPRNLLGARDDSQPLKGNARGSLVGQVPGIDKDNLIALGYDHDILTDVLNGGVTPEFDVPGGSMAEVIFESSVHWTQEDRDAVATYLLDE
jgi:mono/diheme cytochrome c family protein